MITRYTALCMLGGIVAIAIAVLALPGRSYSSQDREQPLSALIRSLRSGARRKRRGWRGGGCRVE